MKAVSVPLDIMAQHVAIVGRTGSGKTYAAKGLIERLLEQGRRVIILDPTGAWWGLRSKANGSPGFQIPVIGGEHGDAPLRADQGELLADWLVARSASAVLDLSDMLIGERHRFVTDFAEALHRLNRTPLHLVIDEADEFCPQNPLPETRRMLHQIDRIVRRGRIRGFRVTLITQRPAVIHKNVITQANTLIAMRLMAPQDRKAIEAWIEGQGDAKAGRTVLDSLARLKRGEGWVWAPDQDILEKAKFPAISTYDSGQAPEDGCAVDEPVLAEGDFSELRAILDAPAPEKEKPTSPRVLAVDTEALRKEYERGYRAAAENERQHLVDLSRRINEWLAGLFIITGEKVAGPDVSDVKLLDFPVQRTHEIDVTGKPGFAHGVRAPAVSMPKAERLILTALAQYPQGRTKTQVAILTGYSSTGGGFANALSALRTKGWIAGDASRLTITDAGVEALGPFQPLPHGRALLDHWMGQLPKAERKVLEALAEVYPRSLSKAQVANRAGYEPGGGGFANALSRLRTLELIKGKAEIKASEDLFS